MSEDFICDLCQAPIKFIDGEPISGCPHHNRNKRSFVLKRTTMIMVPVDIQWDNDEWIACYNGLMGRGETIDEAAASIQMQVKQAVLHL